MSDVACVGCILGMIPIFSMRCWSAGCCFTSASTRKNRDGTTYDDLSMFDSQSSCVVASFAVGA